MSANERTITAEADQTLGKTEKPDGGTAPARDSYESPATKLLCDPDGGYYYPPACDESRRQDGTLDQVRQNAEEEGLLKPEPPTIETPPPSTDKQPDDDSTHISPQTPKGDPSGDTTIQDNWAPDSPASQDVQSPPDSSSEVRLASSDAGIQDDWTPADALSSAPSQEEPSQAQSVDGMGVGTEPELTPPTEPDTTAPSVGN